MTYITLCIVWNTFTYTWRFLGINSIIYVSNKRLFIHSTYFHDSYLYVTMRLSYMRILIQSYNVSVKLSCNCKKLLGIVFNIGWKCNSLLVLAKIFKIINNKFHLKQENIPSQHKFLFIYIYMYIYNFIFKILMLTSFWLHWGIL